MMTETPILQTVNLRKYYRQGDHVTKALDGVNLHWAVPVVSALFSCAMVFFSFAMTARKVDRKSVV